MTKPLQLHHPDSPLSQLVMLFWLGEDPQQNSFDIIPDGCIDLVITAMANEQPLCYGTTTTHTRIDTIPGNRYIGIRFHQGQARHFIDIPACELTDCAIPLTGLFAQWLVNVQDFHKPEQIFSYLSHICRLWLSKHPPEGQHIDNILPLISQPQHSIHQICDQSGISPRQLQRQFKQRGGISPASYRRIARARSAALLLQQGSQTPLVEIAYAAGFTDQSHMNREIRLIFGDTPNNLRQTHKMS